MKQLFLFVFCLLQVTILAAQQKFTIHGKIELLTKSKNLHIGSYTVPIKADGTFEVTGDVSPYNETLIYTDSSGAAAIWIEEGNYTINCREIMRPPIKSALLRTTIVDGPNDAMLYSDFCGVVYNDFSKEKGSKNITREQAAIIYMDSIMKIYPDAKPLPSMIRMIQHYVGDDITRKYIVMLSPELRKDENIKTLEKDFARKDKVKKDIFFENFTLKTDDRKDFTLSQLKNKKAILIDFWASGCGPCRADHPALINLYKKYADKGLAIVSFSMDVDKEDWLNAIAKDKIGDWINVSELSGWQSALVKDYYIPYIPFRFLLDENKKIIKVYSAGDFSEKDIVALLNK